MEVSRKIPVSLRLRNGIVVVANNFGNVNGNVALRLTRRNTVPIIVGHSSDTLRRFGGSVRRCAARCSIRLLSLGSASGVTNVIRRACGGCNRVSNVIGGTNGGSGGSLRAAA